MFQTVCANLFRVRSIMNVSTARFTRIAFLRRSSCLLPVFFWSSGIMECICMLFTFENGVPLMRYGASVVLHHSFPLMDIFNKTEAAVFSCMLCFLRVIPFISLIYFTLFGVQTTMLCCILVFVVLK